jgi:hypothetical protein
LPAFARQHRCCRTPVGLSKGEPARNRAALRAGDAAGGAWAGDHRGIDRCAEVAQLSSPRQTIESDLGRAALGDRAWQGAAPGAGPLRARIHAARHRTSNPSAGSGIAGGGQVVARRRAIDWPTCAEANVTDVTERRPRRITPRIDTPCPTRSAGVWGVMGRPRVCGAAARDTHAGNVFRWHTPGPTPL